MKAVRMISSAQSFQGLLFVQNPSDKASGVRVKQDSIHQRRSQNIFSLQGCFCKLLTNKYQENELLKFENTIQSLVKCESVIVIFESNICTHKMPSCITYKELCRRPLQFKCWICSIYFRVMCLIFYSVRSWLIVYVFGIFLHLLQPFFP